MELKADLTYLTDMSGGDPDVMKEVLNIYLEQIPEFISEYNAALHEKDFKRIASISHKAKTSVAIAGFNTLREELIRLENHANDNPDSTEISVRLVDIEKKLLATENEIKRVIEGL